MRWQHKFHALHSRLLSRHGILVLMAFSWEHQNKSRASVIRTAERCVTEPLRVLPVPGWAVLLLSRSVMISAWRSLILLRSTARLYSICSNCVRGITWFSCTCAHNKKKNKKGVLGLLFLGLSCSPVVLIVAYLPGFCSPGNKCSKSLTNLPLSVCVKVLTIHQNTHLEWRKSLHSWNVSKNKPHWTT